MENLKKRHSKNKIISFINENCGFNNWQHWNWSDKTIWVMSYFHCSKKLAEKVACEI